MTNMTVQAIGVTRRFGTSQRTNNKYDMARLNVLLPLRPSVSQANTFQAAGFRQSEYQLDPHAIDKFIGIQYPAELVVTTEGRPSDNGIETVITGIAQK